MSWRRLLNGAQEYVARVQNPFPPSERRLFNFTNPAELKAWSVYTDEHLGGNTRADLQLHTGDPATARFAGNISSAVSDPSSRLQRSGFCGINTEVEGGVLDLGEFDTLVYRVRGDGRKYVASLRTENWIEDTRNHDVWQAFLFARQGDWAEVEIPMERFMQTWKGRLVDSAEELNPGRITGLGISVAAAKNDSSDGPFQLDLDWIDARRRYGSVM